MASSIPLQPEVCLFFIFYVFERKYAFYDTIRDISYLMYIWNDISHFSAVLFTAFSFFLPAYFKSLFISALTLNIIILHTSDITDGLMRILPFTSATPMPPHPPPPTHTLTLSAQSTVTSLQAPVCLPIILKADPELKPLYLTLGVLELTPSLAVRKFTLPALNKVKTCILCSDQYSIFRLIFYF